MEPQKNLYLTKFVLNKTNTVGGNDNTRLQVVVITCKPKINACNCSHLIFNKHDEI